MTRLSDRELRAMNTGFRRWLQRIYEFPTFKAFAVPVQGLDVLEIGCGTGYGAQFLLGLGPKSYVGIDLMPEQIALAQKRELAKAEFHLQDATDLSRFGEASKDTIVIFGVLHHIPTWRLVIREAARVLRPGGWLYIEEPDGAFLLAWERIFHWGHPDEMLTLRELRSELVDYGFTIHRKRYLFGFGLYAAQKAG
jgi:SAM-dependent methyltransferase